MHVGAFSVRALTVQVQVRPGQTRAAVMIPNVVIVPQASLGRLRVPRLDVFDLKLAVPCWQCSCYHVLLFFCVLFVLPFFLISLSFLFCLTPFA